MSETEEERAARLRGIEEGELKYSVENNGFRISRLEKTLLGALGAIIAAWAKERGLW